LRGQIIESCLSIMIKLSIIVPIYNTQREKLKRCFDSINKIGNQLEFECILIDDGSEDDIGDFCKRYCKEKDAFRYFWKVNGGVSSARNVGIRKAKGEYLFFVDSDDAIDAEIVVKQFDIADADLIITDLKLIQNGKEEIWRAFSTFGNNVQISQVIDELSKHGRLNGPCCKAIRRNYVLENNLNFDETMVLGEDAVFTYDIVMNSPKIKYYNKISYNYYNDQATSYNRITNHTKKVILNYILMYEKILELIKNQEIEYKEKANFINNATYKFVKQIFDSVIDIIVYKIPIYEYEDLIWKALQSINTKNEFGKNYKAFKMRIQFYLLIKKKWNIILAISKVKKCVKMSFEKLVNIL
jgi:glycosyltransferase involved in cell wall biosynthesis